MAEGISASQWMKIVRKYHAGSGARAARKSRKAKGKWASQQAKARRKNAKSR